MEEPFQSIFASYSSSLLQNDQRIVTIQLNSLAVPKDIFYKRPLLLHLLH